MSLETAPDNMPPTTQIDTPALPPPQRGGDSTDSQELTPDQRRAAALLIVAAIVVILLVIASVVFLLNQPSLKVAQIRDVFIIFMAIQSLLSGLALVVLLVQLARLINLLQNEIKPILDTTNEIDQFTAHHSHVRWRKNFHAILGPRCWRISQGSSPEKKS